MKNAKGETKEKDVIKCVHGLEYDSCFICCAKSRAEVSREVKNIAMNKNWRTAGVYAGTTTDDPNYEIDYDIEFDYDDFEVNEPS